MDLWGPEANAFLNNTLTNFEDILIFPNKLRDDIGRCTIAKHRLRWSLGLHGAARVPGGCLLRLLNVPIRRCVTFKLLG